MNRGQIFSTGQTPRAPQEHKDSLCFTATVAQDRQLFPPRRTDCRKQAPSFKLSSGTPPQRPASPSVLRQAAPPRHSTTDATDNSSTRTFAGLLYPSIHWHFPQQAETGGQPSVKEHDLSQNGPPRVTGECVSGHVNCTWPHDIRAQPCKHRRLKNRSRNHK